MSYTESTRVPILCKDYLLQVNFHKAIDSPQTLHHFIHLFNVLAMAGQKDEQLWERFITAIKDVKLEMKLVSVFRLVQIKHFIMQSHEKL